MEGFCTDNWSFFRKTFSNCCHKIGKQFTKMIEEKKMFISSYNEPFKSPKAVPGRFSTLIVLKRLKYSYYFQITLRGSPIVLSSLSVIEMIYSTSELKGSISYVFPSLI
ncbi:hypothetical protein CCPUN_09030 [Cardinium endosymbiont of Culicoides punctatus]|nr:hypothetical protein CCPUN_09030 [Cardinium endosymbiont of Culicoides punctatus]